MIQKYIKIALRNIKWQKSYSFINIAGLAIGMAVCILILLYVREEITYDIHHEYKDRIYRIQRYYIGSDGSIRWKLPTLAPSFVPLLENDFPEMEHIARMTSAGKKMIAFGEKHFVEERIFYAEQDISEILTLPFIKGNPKTALKNPRSVVLTESMAHKYFGDSEPLGQELIFDAEYSGIVTGIIRDIPRKSHFHFDILISFTTLAGLGEGTKEYFFGSNNFSDNVCPTYMRLAENVDIEDVETRIPEFLNRHLGSWEVEGIGTVQASERIHLEFMKVTDIHLHSHTMAELEPNGDIRYVWLFTTIAAFILIIACINFINLSTARASKRAKEVGLKKVVGANRRILTIQFLTESLFFALLSLVLAIVIVYLVLPYFNNFSGHDIKLNILTNISDILLLFFVLITTGIVAGLFPAIYISAFKPITILRGELTKGRKGIFLRKILVVLQFTISVILIISVIIVYRQMSFINHTKLGFDRENIILIPMDAVIKEHWLDFKQQLLAHPNIVAVTASKRAPAGHLLDSPGFRTIVNGEVVDSEIHMPHNRTEHDFFKTYGIKIIAGRDFSLEYSSDATAAFILNDMAVRKLGWKRPENAIGAPMSSKAPDRDGKIIGVVQDFNYESLHHAIKPMLSYIRIEATNTIGLRLAPGNLQETIAHVQKVCDAFHPGVPVSYTFMDDRINQQYQNELRMMEIFGYFSLFAIIVACLGLFGLASFTAEQRTKEVGIRKTLGATVKNITLLLSKEFTKWVIMANIIAWPISYIVMETWLQNFAFRVQIGIAVFPLTTIMALAIAILTVSYQSIRAALANPIDALRYE
jgi:putative ABC transport system permease protein